MSKRTATLVFACLGHFYIHFFTAFYFVIVLSLEVDWSMSYPELIELWTIGAALVGAMALPAGWLADKWRAGPMMVLFFVGMGASSILAGFSPAPTALVIALSGLGLFAAIYHPVGLPWLIRHADRGTRGRVLAVNGVFGSVGSAVAGLIAGFLIDVDGWRFAFIAPGVVSVLTGLALGLALARGRVADVASAEVPVPATRPSRDDTVRVFMVLLFAMFLGGVIYNSTQTALPKVFSLRGDNPFGEGAFGIGLLVAIVYTAGGAMQLGGGYLADRFPLKPLYVAAFLIQAPLLYLAATLAGLPLLVVASLMVMAGIAALPAENLLLANYAPASRHGVVFGVKFVLSFGTAPLAVALVSWVTERTGAFHSLFVLLATFAVLVMSAALFLPRSRTSVLPDAVPG